MKNFTTPDNATLAETKKLFFKHYEYLKNKRFLNRLWKLYVTDEALYLDFEAGVSVDLPACDLSIKLDEAGEIVWNYQPYIYEEFIKEHSERGYELELEQKDGAIGHKVLTLAKQGMPPVLVAVPEKIAQKLAVNSSKGE